MKTIKKLCLSASLLVLSGIGCQAWAQGQQLQVTDGFKNYRFGSVEALITSAENQAAPGQKLKLNVAITNNNDYPIIDGSVYVKVFRKQKIQHKEEVDYFKQMPDKEIMRNGDILTDQYMALEKITLKPKQKKLIPFVWQVPENILPGEYKMVSYFQSARKFDLLGLTFTDDVVGNFYSFTISGDQDKKIVEFDRNNVKLNDEPHDLVSFLKLYDEAAEMKIEAPLVNQTDSTQEVTVSWDTYYWDGLLEKNKIQTDKETITLEPNETKTITYTIPGNSYPVNYVIAKADWLDTHSILNIRFARSTQERARTNFMGMSAFPVPANQPVTIFSTAHLVKAMPFIVDMSGETKEEEQQSQYQVDLAVKDKNQQVIETYSYKGEISGKVMGLESQFVPKQKYDYLVLEATIRDANNAVVDQSSLVYDCQVLDPSQCTPIAAPASNQKNIQLLIVLVLAIIFLIAIIVFLVKRGKPTEQPPTALMILLCLGLGFFYFSPQAQAASDKQTIMSNFLGTRAYIQCGITGCLNEAGWTAVEDVDSKVTYDATSSANEGTPLTVGQTFEVGDTTHSNPFAIYWYVQGYWYASPYGCWNNDLSWNDSYKNSACEYEIFDLSSGAANATCKGNNTCKD